MILCVSRTITGALNSVILNTAKLSWYFRVWRERIGLIREAVSARNFSDAFDVLRNTQANNQRHPSFNGNGINLLVIDRKIPDPTMDSGSLRMIRILKLIRSLGYEIVFVADIEPPEKFGIREIDGLAITCLPLASLPDAVERASLVWMSRFQTVEKHLPLVRSLAPSTSVIFDTVDLHFVRESRRLNLTSTNSEADPTEAIRRREVQAASLADVTIVVSELEEKILKSFSPGSAIEVVSNIHEPTTEGINASNRSDLLFIGGTRHAPNRDALTWLHTELWSTIRDRLPNIQLHVVGDISQEECAELEMPGVHFHGKVDDLLPHLQAALISIAPLRFGAGVKGKVNTAMSYGLPVVATSIAVEGMNLKDNCDALIADNAIDFADAVFTLVNSDSLRSQLSQAGLNNIRKYYSPTIALQSLRRAISKATTRQ